MELKSGVVLVALTPSSPAFLRGDSLDLAKSLWESRKVPFHTSFNLALYIHLDLIGLLYDIMRLDGLRRRLIGHLDNIINMIAHRHEKVEKQFASTLLHFHLHGSTPFESLTTSDDESQVMSAETRV